MTVNSIGILGAGKVGIVLAQLALRAGYKVHIAGSGDPDKIALTVKVLAPDAIADAANNVATSSDVIILALPLSKFRSIPKDALKGKLVIDAMNYWWEVDGKENDIIAPHPSSSEAVQAYLSESRVVKAFSHMGYHDLYDEPKPAGSPDRKAIAVAGDNEDDVMTVSEIINNLGFDPVVAGRLNAGIKLGPGTNVFGASVDAKELKSLVNNSND